MACYLNLICDCFDIQYGTVKLVLRGLHAYKVASRFNYDSTTCLFYYYVVSTLHNLIQESTLQWNLRHVKGHQDDNVDFEKSMNEDN